MNYNIFKSIKGDITEITSDILDAEIDRLIDNEILKDIPYFGIGFKLLSITQKIAERSFLKKIMRFLYELKDIPQEEREKFIKQLENQEENKKAGEKLLIIINRLDDEDKSTIIGKLFKATIEGNLSYSDFIRLTSIVEKVILEDLISFGKNWRALTTFCYDRIISVWPFQSSFKNRRQRY